MQRNRGYADPDRMFSVKRAEYDWILCLDTDEILSPKLRKDLRSIVDDISKNNVAIKTAMIHLDQKEDSF